MKRESKEGAGKGGERRVRSIKAWEERETREGIHSGMGGGERERMEGRGTEGERGTEALKQRETEGRRH